MATLLSLSPEGCIAVDSGVVLGIYRAPIKGARVGEVQSAILEAAARCPGGLVSVGVFRLSPEFPIGIDVDQNRAELAELLRTLDRVLAANANVIEFGGIRAAAMRLICRAIRVIARPRSPGAEFARLSDAITWLRPHAARVGVPCDPAFYVRLYREVEQHLEQLDVERGVTRRSVRV
jgi:hypothetical protein